MAFRQLDCRLSTDTLLRFLLSLESMPVQVLLLSAKGVRFYVVMPISEAKSKCKSYIVTRHDTGIITRAYVVVLVKRMSKIKFGLHISRFCGNRFTSFLLCSISLRILACILIIQQILQLFNLQCFDPRSTTWSSNAEWMIHTTSALARGISVDGSRTICHMEAYVEHSITTDALRECVHWGRDRVAAIGKLPAELIDLTMGRVGRPCYLTGRMQWAKYLACCINNTVV